ncbi:MAG: DUF2252 family protein [Gammaproteobacteria bacterium]|nr:DUF2252 family protein [Gammaproteobacteria bacterium]MBI5615675.1 DUF2252 family protein [Gammaproteobacteria bacterium]
MQDVVESIRAHNAGRDPERLALKLAKMRTGPFVFLRGTCPLFYARLGPLALPVEPPRAWCCGDLHFENFGSYKGDNGLVYFDITDFDEAMLAPAVFDPLRLVTSVLTAAPAMKLEASTARDLVRSFIDVYAATLAAGKARWIERDTAEGLVKTLLASLRERRRIDWLAARTALDGRRRRLRTDGRHALPATKKARRKVEEIVAACTAHEPEPRFFEVLDVARRVAGTGSLGLDRHVVLVRGKGSPDGNYLLDLKEALPPAPAVHVRIRQPAWASEAHRVVAVQTRMQAISVAFLHAVARRRRAYVLRALQPSEDRVRLEAGLGAKPLRRVLEDMARLVAWAELRSAGREGAAGPEALIAFGAAVGEWREELLQAAIRAAKQTVRDWEAYVRAYDEGAFEAR